MNYVRYKYKRSTESYRKCNEKQWIFPFQFELIDTSRTPNNTDHTKRQIIMTPSTGDVDVTLTVARALVSAWLMGCSGEFDVVEVEVGVERERGGSIIP